VSAPESTASAAGRHDPAELDAQWATLAVVRPEELLGTWRGTGLDTGHPAQRLLTSLRWYGKRFHALDRVDPILCRGEDGELFAHEEAAKGGASLWSVEFRGEVTATMVYDGQPILDHFKRIDDDTLMGIMNGTGALHDGQHYYFLLERT
jgi:hypothetical protein